MNTTLVLGSTKTDPLLTTCIDPGSGTVTEFMAAEVVRSCATPIEARVRQVRKAKLKNVLLKLNTVLYQKSKTKNPIFN